MARVMTCEFETEPPDEVIYMTPRKCGKQKFQYDFYKWLEQQANPKVVVGVDVSGDDTYAVWQYDEIHHFSVPEWQYKTYMLSLSDNPCTRLATGDLLDYPTLGDKDALL